MENDQHLFLDTLGGLNSGIVRDASQVYHM